MGFLHWINYKYCIILKTTLEIPLFLVEKVCEQMAAFDNSIANMVYVFLTWSVDEAFKKSYMLWSHIVCLKPLQSSFRSHLIFSLLSAWLRSFKLFLIITSQLKNCYLEHWGILVAVFFMVVMVWQLLLASVFFLTDGSLVTVRRRAEV